MNGLLALTVTIVIVGAVLAVLQSKRPRKAGEHKYMCCPGLFSEAERSFLGVLDQLVGEEYRVFGKVRLADVLLPESGLPKAQRHGAFNRIARKHLDFVLCKKDDLSVVCAVELDDKSHGRRDRVSRDEFLDQAMASAGVVLIRFPAKRAYALTEVAAKLGLVLAPASAVSSEPDDKPLTLGGDAETTVKIDIAEASEDLKNPTVAECKPEASVCQKCGAEMVKRKAAKGPHAGKWFWACSGYPRCRCIVPIG